MKLNRSKEAIVFTKYFDPVSAGREINLFKTYSGFCQRGWKVTLFTSRSTHIKKNVLKNNEIVGGINVRRYDENQYIFPKWITGVNFDHKIICFHGLQHFPDLFILSYLLFLKMLGKKNFVVMFSSHGLYSYRYQFDVSFLGVIKKHIDNILTATLINFVVDGFRSVSNKEAYFMRASGVKKIMIIENGLPSEALKRNHKPSIKIKKLVQNNKKYVLQIGRIDKSKNFETVIRAMTLVKDRKVKCFIVGPTDDKDYADLLSRLIINHNLQNQVYMLGEVTGSSKYYLLKHAAAYLQMSHSEGFGNAVYEAMGQGCVCIVSAGTALSNLIKNFRNGFTVRANDYAGVAKKIDYVLDPGNKKTVLKMQKINIQTSSTRTWEKTSQDVERFYLNVYKKLHPDP